MEFIVNKNQRLGFPLLPACVFFLCWSRRTSPYLSALKTPSVRPFSFCLQCCSLGLLVFYLYVFFVSLFCLPKSKGHRTFFKMSHFSRTMIQITSRAFCETSTKPLISGALALRHIFKNLTSEPPSWIIRKLLPWIKT